MNDRDCMTVVMVIQDQFLFPTGVPDRSLVPRATPSMNNHDDGTLGMETGVSHHQGPVAGSEYDLIRPLLAKRRMKDRNGTIIVMVIQDQFLFPTGVPDRSLIPTATPSMNNHDDGSILKLHDFTISEVFSFPNPLHTNPAKINGLLPLSDCDFVATNQTNR
eukprot:scaffold103475_cov67-Attheya_sp.AAC.4